MWPYWISLALILGGVAVTILSHRYILGSAVTVLGCILALLARWSPKGDDVSDSLTAAGRLLFPPVFKWIGFAMAVGAVAIMLIDTGARWAWIPGVLGLGITLWSRDRREDEFTRQVRFSAAWLTLGGMLVGAPVVMSVLELATHKSYPISMGLMAFITLAIYHALFFALKFKIRHE